MSNVTRVSSFRSSDWRIAFDHLHHLLLLIFSGYEFMRYEEG